MSRLRLSLTDRDWARAEIRGKSGDMHVPEGVIVDRTATGRRGQPDWYLHSFTFAGDVTLDLPAGAYSIRVERGMEYKPIEVEICLVNSETRKIDLALQRWVDLAAEGWWSGDLHVHRPDVDVPALLLAEDLHLASVISSWPAGGAIAKPREDAGIDDGHVVMRSAIEDERSGGAWILHGAPAVDLPDDPWTPPSAALAAELRRPANGLAPFLDLEKPLWWETPVVVALARPDTIGVLHNCINKYGAYFRFGAEEAVSLRRASFPSSRAMLDFTLDTYYRFLGLGFHIMPSAGSASGVLPSPPGANRVYVRQRGGPLRSSDWLLDLRLGNAFVTNGPVISWIVEQRANGRKLVRARARDNVGLASIELIADGSVVASADAHGAYEADATFETKRDFAWAAVRAVGTRSEPPALAHSCPIFFRAPEPSQVERDYFVRWIDDLTRFVRSRPGLDPVALELLLDTYSAARGVYRSAPA